MPVSNLEIKPYIQTLLSLVPAILILIRWVAFWILDSALAQFYEDVNGTKTREQLSNKSRDYVTKIAPGSCPRGLSSVYEIY